MDKLLVYLACPYTHDDPAVREDRYRKVSRVAGLLMLYNGVHVYSPISMGHQLWHEIEALGGSFTWDFWEELDTVMVKKCDALWVYCLPGWQDSVGVTAEIKIAKAAGIPVQYIIGVEEINVALSPEPPQL